MCEHSSKSPTTGRHSNSADIDNFGLIPLVESPCDKSARLFSHIASSCASCMVLCSLRKPTISVTSQYHRARSINSAAPLLRKRSTFNHEVPKRRIFCGGAAPSLAYWQPLDVLSAGLFMNPCGTARCGVGKAGSNSEKKRQHRTHSHRHRRSTCRPVRKSRAAEPVIVCNGVQQQP